MLRLSALTLAIFVAGCSSASSAPDDAGRGDAGGSHDSGHKSSEGGQVGSVCSPAPVEDAGGSKDAGSDALPDAAALRDAAHPVDGAVVTCTLDTDCPKGDICDTKAGENTDTCVKNTGATFCKNTPEDGGGAAGTCSENASDMCCSETAGCIAAPVAPLVVANACCPGAAGDTYCQGKLSIDTATCGAAHVCTTCMDTCVSANAAAYQKFLAYQLTDCGCTSDGACYAACHDSTTRSPSSACGMCLASQTTDGLSSTCTLAAAADCSNDPGCTAYQACAGMCPM